MQDRPRLAAAPFSFSAAGSAEKVTDEKETNQSSISGHGLYHNMPANGSMAHNYLNHHCGTVSDLLGTRDWRRETELLEIDGSRSCQSLRQRRGGGLETSRDLHPSLSPSINCSPSSHLQPFAIVSIELAFSEASICTFRQLKRRIINTHEGVSLLPPRVSSRFGLL